ncbi:uncharacterized protein LOC122504013 [Leptopilina heterotoma]|uniref:uncharacterized protein LOC122504013 n=1 Tax=Leptopilina heterotoma TaxID=63436 RepID=UPI001CA958F3|nr:uncharacterized protein LOC122504013 [Leptopilina heterotoma]
MFKPLILVCAFLLAGAVIAENTGPQTENHEENPSVVEEIKNKVVGVVNEAIRQVTDYLHEVQEKTAEIIKKLKEEAMKVTKSVYDKIVEAQQKVKSEVDKAIKEAINYNVTECAEMAKAFDDTGVQAMAEVSRCVTDVMEDADGYTENMKHSADVVMRNLTVIKDEAEKCVENVNNIGSATKAFICVNVAAAKGTWAATKNVPALLGDLGKLTWKITTLLPELTVCSTVNGVKKVNDGSQIVVEKVRECIKARKELAESQKVE